MSEAYLRKKIEEDYTPSGNGSIRLGIGDTGKGGMRRQNFSSRAAKGNLDVIRKRCPHCNHHKVLATLNGLVKCAKCKREIRV